MCIRDRKKAAEKVAEDEEADEKLKVQKTDNDDIEDDDIEKEDDLSLIHISFCKSCCNVINSMLKRGNIRYFLANPANSSYPPVV